MPKNEYNSTSTRREDWETPIWLFNVLNSIFKFELDLAADKDNSKCPMFVNDFFGYVFGCIGNPEYKNSKESAVWKWCNPPYNREIKFWVNNLLWLYKVVVLLPASVGTKWFKAVWKESDVILFLDKRLQFIGAPNVAKFDSCLAIRGALPDGALPDKSYNLLRYGTLVHKRGIGVF